MFRMRPGIPNFNEVSMSRTFGDGVAQGGTGEDRECGSGFCTQWCTNLQFIVGLQAGTGRWRRLGCRIRTSYPRDLEMRATNYMTVQLTNRFGPVLTTNIISSRVYSIPVPGTWPVMNLAESAEYRQVPDPARRAHAGAFQFGVLSAGVLELGWRRNQRGGLAT